MSASTRRQPMLQWVPDEDADAFDRMAIARVGKPELTGDMFATQRTDMSHSVIACGRCHGVYGGDGIKNGVGRCPTKRCTCKRHK